MVVRFFAAKVLPAVTVGAAAVTVYCSSAQGFFPPVPVGSGEVSTPPPVSPIIPVVPPPVPPPPPPPFIVSPPPVAPLDPPPCSPPTHVSETPEPATVVSGLIGLGALGAAAVRKKLGKKN